MFRHVASAAMLVGLLLLPVNASARGQSFPDVQSCQLSDTAYLGLASTLDGSFETCGTADLQASTAFGVDDYPVAGARRLGAVAWDREGQRFWACDRGTVVGAI